MERATEDSSEVKKNEKNRTDVLSRLDGYPHLLKQIFIGLHYRTLLEAEKVSSSWKQIVSTPDIWKSKWDRNQKVSPIWKILTTRMKYVNPKLFKRVKERDDFIYRHAYDYVEQNIQQIGKLSVDIHHPFIKKGTNWGFLPFCVNKKNVYISDGRYLVVVNRWTKTLKTVKLDLSVLDRVCDMQLNNQFLAIELLNGRIILYNIKTYKRYQAIKDRTPNFPLHIGFCLGSGILATLYSSNDTQSLKINVRGWNSSVGKFGPDIEKVIYLPYEFQLGYAGLSFKDKIYLDDKFLIVDVLDWTISRRIITVFDRKSLQQIRQRTFSFEYMKRYKIKKECCNGVIIVEMGYSEKGPGFAAWNIEEDTIQKITNLPTLSVNSDSYVASMNHNPNYVFIFNKTECGYASMDVLSPEGWRHNETYCQMQSFSNSFRFFDKHRYYYCNMYYFDGVQFMFVDEGEADVTFNLIDFI